MFPILAYPDWLSVSFVTGMKTLLVTFEAVHRLVPGSSELKRFLIPHILLPQPVYLFMKKMKALYHIDVKHPVSPVLP